MIHGDKIFRKIVDKLNRCKIICLMNLEPYEKKVRMQMLVPVGYIYQGIRRKTKAQKKKLSV